jgi:hypothetical protein
LNNTQTSQPSNIHDQAFTFPASIRQFVRPSRTTIECGDAIVALWDATNE